MSILFFTISRLCLDRALMSSVGMHLGALNVCVDAYMHTHITLHV